MIWPKKVKAGALQFVLFIGTIIAVLLLSFVLVSYSHMLFKKKTNTTIALIQTTDQKFEHLFTTSSSQEAFKNPKNNTLGIRTNVQSSYWGLMELRKVTSKKGKLTFTKIALMGNAEKEKPALYLKDNQRPMVVAGDTKIIGTSYLPEQGIKVGNIGGDGYTKPQLVYGKQLRSRSKLPQLGQTVKNQLSRLAYPYFEPRGVEVKYKKGIVLKNSFMEETLTIKGHSLNLEELELTGNITIWAARKITVHNSAKLQDVVLIAPYIEIGDGVQGYFQAIASEHIKVGKSCHLDYPTVLAVKKRKVPDNERNHFVEPEIILGSRSSISGMLLYLDENKTKALKANIKIEENAKVTGEVYCRQNLELKGSVHGSVITNFFITLENGKIYQNHLFNGKIEASLLPQEYGGLCIENKPANQVMKWLY
ncbi:hypothetical protein HME9304_02730 [Flagellimonas maritima]|uniref:Uncharacterized protein n=1 Tax=Flagellimonas maritima TaxID=1383885 RepID=A0A2Z4LVD5_9FLAO|nr:hypothetical protein [Allomuricauda aurantiaca]AWX45703.1 hypothetical protein HME9304_02730 [Allomuricauda aurantiaca]